MPVMKKEDLKRLIDENNLKSMEDIGNLLTQLEKEMIEEVLQGELDSHLGYSKYDYKHKETDNYRNGYTSKEVYGKTGNFIINVPRDRESSFEPKLVKKREKDISKIEEIILLLYQKGLTTRDIQNYLMEVYNYEISPETISNITDRVMEKAIEWQNRPLEELYPIVFIDGLVNKVKDGGEVKNKTAYIAVGIDIEGKKDVLGIWISESETARFWLNIMNELKNRGVKDILIICSDNLPGIESALRSAFPHSEVQICIVHQIRNNLRHVSYKDRKEVINGLKEIYQAPTEEMALAALERFEEKWGKRYPHIGASWRNNWESLSAFFKYPPEIRRLIYTTNPIESLNSQIRKFNKSRTIFPNDDALFKGIYLAIMEVTKRWTGKIKDWPSILAELSIYFEDRGGGYL